MKKIIIALFVVFLLLILFFLFTPWGMTLKTLKLLLSILPIGPAELPPDVIREVFSKDGNASFYIFRPADTKKHPGIIISLGIHPEGAEDKRLQKIFQGLVKNGIVVITVDSTFLKESLIDPKEIKNLVEAFQFLEKKPYIHSNKIGFLGLSVGSPLAFLAAGDPEIREEVKFILWSGGYFNAKELIIDVLSKSFLHEGKIHQWEPSPRIQDVVQKNLERFSQEKKTLENRELIEKIAKTQNRQELEKLFQELPPSTAKILESISPKTYISKVKAPLFILHGTKDQLIPFSHSVLLSQMYPGKKEVLISEKYGHTSPQKPSFKDLFRRDFWQVLFLSNKLLEEIF